MGIAAEALPLDGPLEGGTKNASVIVEPLEAGRARFPRDFFEHEGGKLAGYGALLGRADDEAYLDVPVPAYLVRHPTAGALLVDTGLHPSIASDPSHNLGRRAAGFYSLEHGRDVTSQLRERGLGPGDIEVVVLTHLHIDHASAISEFPESTFVLSGPEWEAATGARIPLLGGYRRAHFDHAVDYRTVDFDGDGIESYGSFGRTFDLFGDGSVRLAFTPGHSAGHCSVLLRLPRRDFVVLADVSYTWRQLQGGPEPLRPQDRHNWRRSLHEAQAYIRAYPYALVVPGHDPEFWQKLDARYEK
ncbi:MAG TPA: N-acyl homoserine lactonase family protein [Solirubrobacterales bacterium]|jgi:glyoxylase-like metal-dependent hydrolase (beta-lactamase superfamily II)|nr:N-acyl homoserine lactonase family protein [Solirubrobacterales bacterium]